jgi:asparagine synthase (glutamine-hydrolysing)
MNGLAGIVRPRSPSTAQHAVHRMIECLRHDARSVSGLRSFASLQAHVGWMASPTPRGSEVPVRSTSGLITLLLTGEELSNDPQPSHAAEIADDFEKFGLEALRQLNGPFSGVIVDARTDTITLFNDRLGRGRVYYHQSAEGFHFSTEAKSLLAVLPVARRIDSRGLAEFFAVGCVLQNRSLFAGVALLPPASAWTIRRDGYIHQQRYFDPGTWEQQERLSAADYDAQLSEVFAQIGERYVADGSPAALSLTGGLDSRAVLAWSKFAPDALPCYTFGGPYRDCADVVIARRLAGLCGQPHTTIPLGADFFARFPALAARSVYLSDGTMDVSGAVELHVNQQARAIAPVRLTGNYGSEILRSHIAFRPARLDRSLFTPEFNRLLDEAADTYAAEAAGHRLSFIAFKQVPWHHHARFTIEKSQLTPRSPFLDHDVVALAYRAPPTLGESAKPLLQLIARGNPQLAALATDRALRSRGVSVLSRAARAWQEFTAKAEYAYDYGMPPWLARADRALSRLHLERLFLGRHKFYHFRVWYRDQLRHAVREQAFGIDAGVAPSCYRAGAARQLVEEHLSGRANRTLDLHKLLSVQLIERTLLRPPCRT